MVSCLAGCVPLKTVALKKTYNKHLAMGAVLVALGFVVSTALIFMGGNVAFGLISLVPVVLAGLIIYRVLGVTTNKSFDTELKNGEKKTI
jgi:hypothetical protein